MDNQAFKESDNNLPESLKYGWEMLNMHDRAEDTSDEPGTGSGNFFLTSAARQEVSCNTKIRLDVTQKSCQLILMLQHMLSCQNWNKQS